MPNTCFDGDFRSKPQQNFAGVNRNLHRDQLIQNAAQERKQREEIRKHTLFAIRFQSYLRGYLSRQKWFDVFRKDFDAKSLEVENLQGANGDLIADLSKRLVLFYLHSKDRERIFLLNKLLIHNKDVVIHRKEAFPKQWNSWLQSIFKYNSALLVSLPESSYEQLTELIEIILKIFRLYLSQDQQDGQFKKNSWHYLILNSHFKNLRLFIDKFSQSDGYSKFSESIFKDLLLSPLSLENLSPECNNQFVRIFLIEFLSGPLSAHVKNTILPRICNDLPRNLNANNVIDSFDFLSHPTNSYSFLWMFYSTLKLITKQTNSIENEQTQKFISVIRAFSENLSIYIKTKTNFSFKDKENSDDEEESLDGTTSDNEALFKSFIGEMFQILNDSSLCGIIVRYMDNILEKDKDSLISISYLCHSMLLFHPFAIHKNRLLHSLAFNCNFLRDLWQFISTESTTSLFDSTTTYLRILSSGVQTSSVDWHQFLPPLTLFCALFNYFLQTLDDVEFFNEYLNEMLNTSDMSYNYSVLPFKLSGLVSMSSVLRDICISLIELAYQDRKVVHLKSQLFGTSQETTLKDDYSIQCWNLLLKSSLKLLRHIYARDIRRQFCPENHWISSKSFVQILPANFNQAIQQRGQLYQEFRGIRHLGREEMSLYGSPIPVKDIVNVTIIQEMPFVVPFEERVKIMHSLVSFEKRMNERDMFEALHHGFTISIRRNYIYEDSFEKLSEDKIPNLKKMIRIQLVSALGLEETGIDGGGVFREFLSETLKTAFDPNRGFFKVTNDGLLYPNPSIRLLVENSEKHYFFIGRLLGKAIYENMLAELPLAPFFLAKLLTNNSDVEMNHLASLDPVLYKNLISLKNYKGDVSDLGLDFSVITCELGTNIMEELKTNGSNIPVTNNNRIEYIHLMSDYKLNKQIRSQCAAFKLGFYNVVNLDWIQMFDTKELQILLSGAPTAIDLDDLMQHTVYTGGYNQDHIVIKLFWQIVAEFDENDKRKLLKFITSCSRPPLLGFKDLYPALCIQNAGKEPDRLPTSSTCMNLLKLPEVYDKHLMKEKLMYSINSGSGFELS